MLDNQLSKYVNAITGEAQHAKEKAQKEIKNYKSNKLKKAELDIQAKTKADVRKRCDIIHEQIGRDFSEKEMASRKRLYIKRNQIQKEVFEAAREKLEAFAASENYIEFLRKSVDTVQHSLVGRDKHAIIYLRPEDMQYEYLVKEAFVLPCQVQSDNTIRIGGIKVKFAMMIIDDTLDSRLYSQKVWFEETSGLDIN